MNLESINRSWKRLLLTLCYICLSTGYGPMAVGQEQSNAERRGKLDWIFVLDTSASMRGVGGTNDIFDRVKAALENFIDAAEEGDSVTFYTFDRDTTSRPTVRILDETDRRDLRNTVRGLDAHGERTHTGKAVVDALDRARELWTRGQAEQRTPSIVLLTDGIEDVRGISNPVSIPSNVQRLPGEPYIYYVSLGQEHDLQLDAFVRSYERGSVIHAPNPDRIKEIVETLRKSLEPPKPSPTPSPTPLQVNIRVEPGNLDFGEVKPGKQTRREKLNLSSNVDTVVQLALEDQPSAISLVEPSNPVSLKAGQLTSVEISMNTESDAAAGPHTFRLKASVRNDIESLPANAVINEGKTEGRLEVRPVSLMRRLIGWAAVILFVLLCAFVAYCVYERTMPWELRKEFERRHRLEGELEVLRPRVQPEQAYINLGSLKSRRVELSHFLPNGSAHTDDAELEAAYAKRIKSIRLRRTNGAVRVNGAEVAYADLYDGDTVELGDARFRFNWINGQRNHETGDDIN